MGEYWKPVNVTRREFIHPHRVGCGLKLPEWHHQGSAVLQRMAEAWPVGEDDVRALSDYGEDMQLSGVRTEAEVSYAVTNSYGGDGGYRDVSVALASKGAR